MILAVHRVGATVPRLALIWGLLVGSMLIVLPQINRTRAHSDHSDHTLAATLKPSWRIDTANSGDVNALGPSMQPNEVFEAAGPGSAGTELGIELDAAGNVVFEQSNTGTVFDYKNDNGPAGALQGAQLLWSSTTSGTGDGASPSQPVASNDGAWYTGADNGNLYQIYSAGIAAAGTAPNCVVFSTRDGNAPTNGRLSTVPLIDASNVLYLGDDHGVFYAVQPPAPTANGGTCPAHVAPIWTFAASGSTQVNGAYAGTTSDAPFAFSGAPATDGMGDIFVASTDSNPHHGNSASLGTLYSLNAGTGAMNWQYPLQGAVVNAVVYDAATNEVIVTDTGDEALAVTATGANAGTLVWATSSASLFAASSAHTRGMPAAAHGRTTRLAASQFVGSPVLSRDGQIVYCANTNNALYAVNATTGAPMAGFGAAGTVILATGSGESPILDNNGTLYLQEENGQIDAFNATNGGLLFTIPAGTVLNDSGGLNGTVGSMAIDQNGVLYIGVGRRVRGFSASSSTATNTPSPTISDFTSTSTDTPVPATGTSSSTSTNTTTNTPAPVTSTGTDTSTSTPPPATDTRTSTTTPTDTATSTATSTSTSTCTPTDTPVPPTGTGTSSNTSTNTPTDTAVPTTNTGMSTTTPTSTPVPATATSTSTPVPATATATTTDTATNTPVPATGTSTSTNTPTNTATSTGTDTSTPVPPTVTSTSTDTSTSTVVPATSTSTSTSTSTPVPETTTPMVTPPSAKPTGIAVIKCAFVTEAAERVATADEAIVYVTSKPDAELASTFVTAKPLYPGHAYRIVVQPNFSLTYAEIRAHVVNGYYRYAFSDGSVGVAALFFILPPHATHGTVRVRSTAHEACGTVYSSIGFTAKPLSGSAAQLSMATEGATTGRLVFALPRDFIPPGHLPTSSSADVHIERTIHSGHTSIRLVFSIKDLLKGP